MTLTFKI